MLCRKGDAVTLLTEATANFMALRASRYPGRGLVVGLDSTGRNVIQVYWIMGRSSNSRNRVFELEARTGRLFTEPADPSKVEDPRLIIYNAMLQDKGAFVVSNGSQTDMIAGRYYGVLMNALRDMSYEPDSPIYTPRITATCGVRTRDNLPFAEIAIHRKSPTGDGCDVGYWFYDELPPGYGYCITTYEWDAKEPTTFRGEPRLIPFYDGVATDVLGGLWQSLSEDNRVAIAVKFIDRETRQSMVRYVNKYHKSD
ncbi:MAG TPA: IMP cyclohydrolase [Candidatus Paceibacterota bacterium]|nr:IMP cyclohydrolase [Candidatus Paceibacterota bacterium]